MPVFTSLRLVQTVHSDLNTQARRFKTSLLEGSVEAAVNS